MTNPIRSIRDVRAAGLVSAEVVAELAPVEARYPVALTGGMAALVDTADPADPIARQFIPDTRELEVTPEELADPIGDSDHTPVKGVVHRYPDRVLLKPVHICPVYCRFCFRREVVGPGGAGGLSARELAAAFAYIRDRSEIWEVIVTGGDPLMLSSTRAQLISHALSEIPHIRIVRWHSRVPLVDPARVTNRLVDALKAPGKTSCLAIHANHPREFTPAGRAAIALLADAGLLLVSQTVLLRGVNDNVATLEALMRVFLENRIKPYYLHHADLAPGTAHFRTTIAEGQAIVRTLRGRLSGLAQPTYVLDIPGGHGKVPVGPSFIDGTEEFLVRDPSGAKHAYPPRPRDEP